MMAIFYILIYLIKIFKNIPSGLQIKYRKIDYYIYIFLLLKYIVNQYQ